MFNYKMIRSMKRTFPNFDLTLFHDMMNLKFPEWRNPDTRLGPARCCLRPARATKFQGSFSGTFNYHRTTSNCRMSGANHFADIRWSCPWNTFTISVRLNSMFNYKMITSMKRTISQFRSYFIPWHDEPEIPWVEKPKHSSWACPLLSPACTGN